MYICRGRGVNEKCTGTYRNGQFYCICTLWMPPKKYIKTWSQNFSSNLKNRKIFPDSNLSCKDNSVSMAVCLFAIRLQSFTVWQKNLNKIKWHNWIKLTPTGLSMPLKPWGMPLSPFPKYLFADEHFSKLIKNL